jgi:hypothetical protein
VTAPKQAALPALRLQLQAQAVGMLAQFRCLESFRHKGIRGMEREEPVRSFLRAQLPGRFHVGAGAIVSSKDAPDAQHDIIVTDARHGLALLAAGFSGLWPIESVCAVVEVKSGPDLELDTVTSSLAKVRALVPTAGIVRTSPTEMSLGTSPPPVHAMFAYRGPADPEVVVKQLDQHNQGNTPAGQRMALDFIVVLSSRDKNDLETGYFVGYSRTDPNYGSFPYHYYPVRGEDGLQGPSVLDRGADAFPKWYASVVNHLNGAFTYPPNLFDYLGFSSRIIRVDPS